ncbi:hypothetical protein C8Q74DRAFT_194390 [Fomes fomentarius]|nr:hypothetical protein C8Q74DRAFT_194390 [Fomes fomentarius]
MLNVQRSKRPRRLWHTLLNVTRLNRMARLLTNTDNIHSVPLTRKVPRSQSLFGPLGSERYLPLVLSLHSPRDFAWWPGPPVDLQSQALRGIPAGAQIHAYLSFKLRYRSTRSSPLPGVTRVVYAVSMPLESRTSNLAFSTLAAGPSAIFLSCTRVVPDKRCLHDPTARTTGLMAEIMIPNSHLLTLATTCAELRIPTFSGQRTRTAPKAISACPSPHATAATRDLERPPILLSRDTHEPSDSQAHKHLHKATQLRLCFYHLCAHSLV